MTDRVHSLTVVLSDDLRDDSRQLQATVDAIHQLKGVVAVQNNVADPSHFVTAIRIGTDLRQRLHAAIDETIKP